MPMFVQVQCAQSYNTPTILKYELALRCSFKDWSYDVIMCLQCTSRGIV